MDNLLGKIKKVLASQLGGGISWNMISVGFMAISGIFYNIIIMTVYDSAVVGLFTSSFAYYAVISQLAVCGIHFSTLKYISEFHDDEKKVAKIFGSALLSTVLLSIFISILSFLVLSILQNYSNDQLIEYLFYIVPALVFFALNKVMLNYLNGLSKMKAYAVFQSIRSIFIMLAFIFFAIFKIPAKMLTLCFFISEFLLFIIILIFSVKEHYIRIKIDKTWMKEHIRFGIKIMPGNFVLELNARMDIIILRIFVSDSIVGFYSFALRFAEGFYQLLVVVRRNINPLIAQYISKKDINSVTMLKKEIMRYAKYLVPACALLVIAGFTLICYITDKVNYLVAMIPLVIVMAIIMFTSKYIIFGNTLNQGGFPSSEARLNIITLATNVILNFLLIPFLGMYGAAIATAVSYFMFSVILYYSVNKKLDYKI